MLHIPLRYRVGVGVVLAVSPLGLGCQNVGEDDVLSIEVTGSFGGQAFFDQDGGATPDANDAAASGLRLFLITQGTIDTAAVLTADNFGNYRVDGLAVGRYRVEIDSATIGDTAIVVLHDSTTVTVFAGDSVSIIVGVSFPTATLSEVRQMPLGRRVFAEGVVLAAIGAFGDTTLHVSDTATALRATRVQFQSVAPGDSVRLLGRRSSRDGQPTLDDVRVVSLGLGVVRPPERVTTLLASGADGGRLDAGLVRVVSATVSDTVTRQFDFVVTADDGSGPVEVVFDIDAALAVPTITLQDSVTQASILDVTGILVPDGSGAWLLKPRVNQDVIAR